MNLGIFLSPGDSLTNQKKSGQLDRLIQYYLIPYSKNFKKIIIFSYDNDTKITNLPPNIKIVNKPRLIPYQLYQFLLPLIHKKAIKKINVFRVFQAIGGLPLLLTNKPSVVTYGYHYHQFAKIEKQPLKAKLIKLVIKPVLKKASKIIVTSAENQNYLKNLGLKAATTMIPNGVDPQQFKYDLAKKQPFLILSIGRLVHQKNYPLLIKVISHSKFKSKINLIIIGQGQLQSQLESLAKKLNVNLTIQPPQPHQSLVTYYQKTTVFALTSKTEGQPKVLLEALSSACACLTTPFPGNIINHNQTGLIAKSRAPLTKNLDRLLDNQSLRLSLGQKARQEIIQNYDINKLVKKEITLLKHV